MHKISLYWEFITYYGLAIIILKSCKLDMIIMETMETKDEILGSMFITYMHAYCQAFKLKSLFLSYKKKKSLYFWIDLS